MDVLIGSILPPLGNSSGLAWWSPRQRFHHRIERSCNSMETSITGIESRCETARLDGISRLIGNTPRLAVDCTLDGQPRTIHAKLESMNWTGSVKDRMALHIFRDFASSAGVAISVRPRSARVAELVRNPAMTSRVPISQ